MIAAINPIFGHQLNDPLGLSVTADFTSKGYCLSGACQRRHSDDCHVTSTNLISDLERALTTRSTEAGAMLHQLTELFLVNVGHYSADQLDLYDGIFNELVKKVEVAARVKLAQRLASIDGAPAKTIRSLALDDAIEVAEPVLSQSNALDDDTLTHCISLKGQEYLLAIATRDKISETISSQLIASGDRKVLGTLAGNPGATISDPSFGILVQKSANDDWLSECIAGRKRHSTASSSQTSVQGFGNCAAKVDGSPSGTARCNSGDFPCLRRPQRQTRHRIDRLQVGRANS